MKIHHRYFCRRCKCPEFHIIPHTDYLSVYCNQCSNLVISILVKDKQMIMFEGYKEGAEE